MIEQTANAPDLTDYWGVAVYDLGLSEEVFWELTPALFNVLCKRKYKNGRRELANFALIAATLINLNRPKGKSALTIEDVIGKDTSADEKDANPGELLTLMRCIHKKHGS